MESFSLYLPSIISVYIAAAVALTSPGPNFVAITSSAVQSRLYGQYVALGISIGTGIWALFAATGISTLLNTNKELAMILSITGALYLCWLGIKSIRSIKSTGTSTNTDSTANYSQESPTRGLRIGLLIQLTNPKSALFWMAITSLAIVPDSPLSVIAALAIGSFLIALVWHVLLALLFSTGPAQATYLSMKPVFSCVFGVVFIALGLSVFYSILS